MTVKKRPVSPRQKMINLMYIVLLAMLALNVSNEVLKGFDIVGDSLNRTTANAAKENEAIYKNFAQQLAANPTKVKPWYDKAMSVKHMADSLYNLAEQLRWDIAREADGKEGTPYALENKEDLDAAGRVMLAPVSQRGLHLLNSINSFRQRILTFVADKRQAAIIASNLNTDVPRKPDNIGKNWPEYMFESMPSIAAITMLNKLQHDVRAAEGEVLHNLIANIDLKDIRVNEINAYVLPEATTLFPGETFKSRIVMAAVDTTKRPEIYINGRRVSSDGNYNFTVGSPGEYTFSGYIQCHRAANRRHGGCRPHERALCGLQQPHQRFGLWHRVRQNPSEHGGRYAHRAWQREIRGTPQQSGRERDLHRHWRSQRPYANNGRLYV